MDFAISLVTKIQETEFVGGLVGDALKDGTTAIWNGIVYGFQYITIASAQIISTLFGAGVLGGEMVYYASKDGRDKGKIVKHFLIYVGSKLVVMMIRAIR